MKVLIVEPGKYPREADIPSVQSARPIAAKKGSPPRREERILGGSGCCRCLLYGGQHWRWLAAGSRA